MDYTFSLRDVWTYVKRHWFKICLILLVILACVRKNLVFDIGLPNGEMHELPSGSGLQKSPEESLTTGTEREKILSESSFEIPIFGSQPSGSNLEMNAISDSVKIQYLKRFVRVAVKEQEKYDIPASIILATALYQSFAGKRDIAVKGNNHFAIPCTPEWSGGKGIHDGECYRVYENAWSSFRDNSMFITRENAVNGPSLRNKTYREWVGALLKKGYFESQEIAVEITRLIEYYQLDQLDK